MNLHEYQGKSILKSYGVAIQEGIVVDRVEDAVEADNTFSMLMGDDVQARKDFISENAKEANLDI
jgi:DNA gyrase/topoisomerase IV subunit B